MFRTFYIAGKVYMNYNPIWDYNEEAYEHSAGKEKAYVLSKQGKEYAAPFLDSLDVVDTAEFYGTEKVSKIVLKLAPPVMLSQLIQALYNIVDSLFVGRFSEAGLTALSNIKFSEN